MKALYNKLETPTDRELVAKIVAGETALFEVLIRRYNGLLYKIARTYGLNHPDAEDMMQEAHFAAYTQLRSFRGDASYKTWITRILLHKCYHLRHYGQPKFEAANAALPEEADERIQPSIPQQDGQRIVMNKELGVVLEQSLQQLPLIYRSVFVLREVEGFSVAETAELLSITSVNVKVRLNRAKALLQKQLESRYSSAELFEFHLCYCDKIVQHVFERIGSCIH
jgi:RNA polymerase sigma factor (sigma-70 family)